MFVGFMHFIYFIASLRTNIVLLCTFFTATLSLELLSAEYFMIGQGDMVKAEGFQHATGVVLLMLGALSWYLFASLVLESVDFPIVLPVGNLSMKIVGRSQSVRQRA